MIFCFHNIIFYDSWIGDLCEKEKINIQILNQDEEDPTKPQGWGESRIMFRWDEY